MHKIKLIFIILFLTSCYNNFLNYSDLEIRDFLISLKKSKYSYLVNYLAKEPALISFNNDYSIDCSIINIEKKQILVPKKTYEDYNLILTQVAKTLYEYNIRKKNNIKDEIPYEVKILSGYFEIEFLLTHFTPEMTNEIKNTNYKEKICYYFLNENKFEDIIKNEEKTPNKRCLRPAIDLSYNLDTLKKLKKSLNDIDSENFFRVLYDIETEKAKKGNNSYYNTYTNYYHEISKADMEQYRDIRNNIYLKLKSLKSFEKFYKKEIKRLKNNKEKLKYLLKSFTFCSEIK
ncbi:MAG: hypothetical protein N2446_01050 [Elusimicrobiales bacterium]|nr:hypothetical protein [Elusimicrobiales bacterium]